MNSLINSLKQLDGLLKNFQRGKNTFPDAPSSKLMQQKKHAGNSRQLKTCISLYTPSSNLMDTQTISSKIKIHSLMLPQATSCNKKSLKQL